MEKESASLFPGDAEPEGEDCEQDLQALRHPQEHHQLAGGEVRPHPQHSRSEETQPPPQEDPLTVEEGKPERASGTTRARGLCDQRAKELLLQLHTPGGQSVTAGFKVQEASERVKTN